MKFETIKEMYEYLVNTGDLYDKATETYIFVYNDASITCPACWRSFFNTSGSAALSVMTNCSLSAVT